MIVRPGLLTFPTSVPEVGLFGAVLPFSSRTTTPANELAVGFTHPSEIDENVTFVTFTELTGASASEDALAAAGDHNADSVSTAQPTAQARSRRQGGLLPTRIAVITDRSAADDRAGGRGSGFGGPEGAGRKAGPRNVGESA